MLPDVVWVVGPDGDHEDLRYSIRSVTTNAAGLYRKLWVAGTCPDWLTGVETIPLPTVTEGPSGGKWGNIRQSITTLANDDRVADRIVVFNDDIFVTEPISEWVTYSWGTLAERLATRQGSRNTWVHAMQATHEWLIEQGVDGRCFEGHVPIYFDRERLAEVLNRYPAGRLLLYACFFELAGVGPSTPGVNVKCGTPERFLQVLTDGMPYLSCSDEAFATQLVGGYIRGLFREASVHESDQKAVAPINKMKVPQNKGVKDESGRARAGADRG